MKRLTKKQLETLRTIRDKPDISLRELSEHEGLTMKGSYDRINQLKRKGYLHDDHNKARFLRLTDKGKCAVGEPPPLLGVIESTGEIYERVMI